MIRNFSQIQLTNIVASAVELLPFGSELQCTGSHILSVGFAQQIKLTEIEGQCVGDATFLLHSKDTEN